MWMRFGIIGRTGPRMRKLVEFGDRFTGRSTFGVEFGVHHCNKWRLIWRTCATAPRRGPLQNYFGQTCLDCHSSDVSMVHTQQCMAVRIFCKCPASTGAVAMNDLQETVWSSSSYLQHNGISWSFSVLDPSSQHMPSFSPIQVMIW